MVKTMHDKIASAATYCVSGGLVCGGGIMQWLHDLDWNVVAVASGVVLGVANLLVNIYFKYRQTRDYESAIERGLAASPPSEKN